MRALILILSLYSVNLLATESFDKESAKFLYNEHKEMFSKKKIIMTPSICKFQNELAEISGEAKYDCVEENTRANAKNDTDKGDAYLSQTLKEANKMQEVQKTFNKHEMDILLQQTIDNITRQGL